MSERHVPLPDQHRAQADQRRPASPSDQHQALVGTQPPSEREAWHWQREPTRAEAEVQGQGCERRPDRRRMPLVVMREEPLLDEVLRLAAAVGCEVEVAPDVPAAAGSWIHAPQVLVDEAVLREAAGGRVPSRRGVALVCLGPPPAECWQSAFTAGIERVMSLPEDEQALMALLAEVVEGPSSGDGRVLGVLGGRGGAGASVFAAAVAVEAARRGEDALLVDCDPLGGGIDLLLGAEHDGGLRWPELAVQGGRVSMQALRAALPRMRCGSGSLVVLSCGRQGPGPSAQSVVAVVEAGVRAGHTVVCDLPRALDAVGWEVVDRADLIAVVVPAEVRASIAAMRVVESLRGRARRLGAVVRGPAPAALPAAAVAEAVGVELLAGMRAEPRLGRRVECGEFGPRTGGPLARAAQSVLSALWESSGEPSSVAEVA